MLITVVLMISTLLIQNNPASVGATFLRDAVDKPLMDGGANFAMQEEIWKSIAGYGGYYEVSNFARVRSLTRSFISKQGRELLYVGAIRKQILNHNGYWTLHLSIHNKQKQFFIHRLVAEAFVPNPDNKPFVNHIDRNRGNSLPENLEWVTHLENMQHASTMGSFDNRCGENSSSNILTESQVIEIREAYPAVRIADLSRQYGVHWNTIEGIVKGTKWKHLLNGK